MPAENTKYDSLAKFLYNRYKENRPGWEAFERITRRERDYWRALAQQTNECEDRFWPEDCEVCPI